MSFSNTWANCRPGRRYTYYMNQGLMCAGEMAGGWRKKRDGYNDADRDVFIPTPQGGCVWSSEMEQYKGAHSDTWASLNRARGYGSVTVRIQQRVNDWLAHWRLKGYANVPGNLNPDGILGTLSDTAIRYCQTRFVVTSDGIVGATTWGRLIQAPPTA